MFRSLDEKPFSKPKSQPQFGPAPQLNWINIDLLVVDPSYQREIGTRGARNIAHIAEHFEWSKFAPVIVAPLAGGKYTIVDGQHRTTAALLRQIPQVPCQIVIIDRAKQAEAFAAINGNVTKTTPQHLYYAKLAAGDPAASELARVCSAAGVEIVRANKSRDTLQPGEAKCIAALLHCIKAYGSDTLITALQCITQTGDRNPGQVRSSIVEALCKVLMENAAWRDAGEALLRAMDSFEFADVWEEVMAGRRFVLSPAVTSGISDRIREHLGKHLRGKPSSEVGSAHRPTGKQRIPVDRSHRQKKAA